MYPHERSLVTKFKNKPFALLGVNSDKDRQEVRKVAKIERLTWRSFWNGGGTRGGIAGEWGVTAWPTLYLIDHAGVIRYKTVGAPDAKSLDRQISDLVKDTGVDLVQTQSRKPPVQTAPSSDRPADPSKLEQVATGKLNLAKMLADGGKTEKARERYREIIQKYPNTEAADEAKQLLSQLPK
jgi:hypothetical protein